MLMLHNSADTPTTIRSSFRMRRLVCGRDRAVPSNARPNLFAGD